MNARAQPDPIGKKATAGTALSLAVCFTVPAMLETEHVSSLAEAAPAPYSCGRRFHCHGSQDACVPPRRTQRYLCVSV